nr:hypothetical protein [Tanacetum cinerariifolium]
MATSKSSLSSMFSEKPPFSCMVHSKRIDDSTEKYSLFEVNYDVKNLYADFLHANYVDDHFDPLDYWKYKDVYGGGCFDVGGSFKGFDWIDEPVGSDDRSLSGKSKDEFSNDVILDDVVSSPITTLSLLLKMKGKSRVKFTRMRAIIKISKMLILRVSIRSTYVFHFIPFNGLYINALFWVN